MPVRKIPRNHLQVTGRHATSKSADSADFESLLEKEHMLLLDHDPLVQSYEVQPVRIPVPGVAKGYVPDLLVHYRPDEDGCISPSEIREVKKSEDFKRNAEKYAPKFEAAEQYAAQRGWVFRKIDETEIRIPRLGNLKFLSQFRFNEPEPHEVERMLSHLDRLGRTSSDVLIASIAQTDEARLELMPVLWHLVITKRIGIDLDEPFGSNVALWPVESAND
jgi:TnsA endonuclease N terminal/TnsA endonuclease C terminal